MNVLLDTCAIIWLITDEEKLSSGARTLVVQPDTDVFYSPISCAEVACAVARKRLELDRHWRHWFGHFVKLNGWTCLPIDLPVMEEAYSLPDPFHNDPADRIIVATARVHRCQIVTGDPRILGYPHVLSQA